MTGPARCAAREHRANEQARSYALPLCRPPISFNKVHFAISVRTKQLRRSPFLKGAAFGTHASRRLAHRLPTFGRRWSSTCASFPVKVAGAHTVLLMFACRSGGSGG